MDQETDQETRDVPLSTSNVTLKLELIQKRCSELMDDGGMAGLSLEEPDPEQDNSNPYDLG